MTVKDLELNMILLELLQANVRLRRVARTHGGEWAGPCPWCGGRDRFRVWPNEDGGRYWCRGCGKHGDAIEYLRESRGLSFREAVEELGRESILKPSRMVRHEREEKRSSSLKWEGKAETFLKESIESLWRGSDVLSFLHGRGLRDETIRTAALGWSPRDQYEDRETWGLDPVTDERGKAKKLWLPEGLVIPLIEKDRVLRLRIRRAKGELRYYIVPGSNTKPMVLNSDLGSFVIVESELDGLLISQEVGDLIGTIALGSVTMRPDEDTDRQLKEAGLILNCLDFDRAGAEASWGFWSETYRAKVRRWPVPVGKDPSEAFQKELNIRAWIEAGLPNKILSLQREKLTEATIRPFPKEWLQRFDETQLERLAIMTVDGRLSDQEALRLLS